MRSQPQTAASEALAGYAHPAYAQSLAEFGDPVPLARCGGHLISRPLPGLTGRDAIGSYPLFACRDWQALGDDLDVLEGELAAVAMVLDPFAELTERELHRCFPDRVVAFKQHYVVDLSNWGSSSVSAHHRRDAKRGLARVRVDRVERPAEALDDWCRLYGSLVEKHGIRGIAAFSRAAFAAQLRVPGIVAFRAHDADRVVGMALWYMWRGVAYSHLNACTSDGYVLGASYALMSRSIEHFADSGARWIDLGGGAGVDDDPTQGLVYFKQGWATDTRMAYFCGRILNGSLYSEATRATRSEGQSHFPAYRASEAG
jgi:hypothetical protein